MKSFQQTVLTLSLLVSFLGISSSFATKYYVSPSGDNNRSLAVAQSSATPWQTVSFAITQVASGDSIVALPGTYGETNVILNKSVKLFGNETGGVPGEGQKPLFNGVSGTPNGSIFILQAAGIVIQNFEIHVNQVDVIRGIFSNGGGFNRLQILDNHIFSVSTLSPFIFNSYGIQLGTTSVSAGADSFRIARNIIMPLSPATSLFGRGIRLVGGFGTIGGATLADSNQIVADYGIQAGNPSNGRFQALNNHISGVSAAVELNVPAANRTHTLSGNIFNTVPGFNSLSLVEIKNNNNANSIIQINGNQFVGHQFIGLFSTRSKNVIVTNNTFIPSDTAFNFTHIVVNTKQQTTATDASIASEIVIKGNSFQSSSNLAGTAIAFQNHNSGANPPFTNVVIGGPGAEANIFPGFISQFLVLDTASGPSTQNPLWNQAGYKTTLMRPATGTFDLQANSFDVGSGPLLPALMSEADLIALENRILHGVDYDSLGFAMVKGQSVFVTQQSFLPPFHSTPSLQRAINQAGANDDWTVFIQNGIYPGRATVRTNLTFDKLGAADFEAKSLVVNAPGKSLKINNALSISDSLDLVSGHLVLSSSSLLMKTGSLLVGGSSTNYVETNGNGFLQFANPIAGGQAYPIGTNLGYFPIATANSGVQDLMGFRVQNEVLSGGLSGTPVDSVVGATWVAMEGTAGGSNLILNAGWPGSSEKPFFTRSNTVLQGFSGSWANISASPISASGTDPYLGSYTSVNPASLINLPLRVHTVAAPQIVSNIYYVDNITGDDSRLNALAKDPSTPWKTIANAVAKTSAGDTIQVFAGNYSEFDIRVNKSLTILGNVVGVGVGAGTGTGVKPVVNGAGPSTLDSSIFIVSATNVNIRNFNIKVDLVNIKLGINAPQSGFGGLVIEDNLIESTGDISGNNDVVVLSHAILLGRLDKNGNDSIIVRRNTIDREGPTKKWFSRGVRWWGGRGMIGGNNPIDGNVVHADFAVQCGGGNTGGRVQTRNNNIFGRAAGVEYNTPPPTFRHTIANNTIQPLDSKEHFALVEIKSNIRTTGPSSPVPPFIDIENNVLQDFYRIGVALTRSRKCNVVNNIFTPRADSANYIHVWVNSKQRTAGSAASQQPLANIETLIQGNTFNGNNVFGGYGIAFQNANTNATGTVFTVNDMGGAGSLANTFGSNIAKVVYLDTVTGPSGLNAFWSKPGINWVAWPSTPMRPVRDNFDFSGNLYNVGTGSKRPSEMSNAELLLLEDRVVHKIEADTLGFVTMKPNHVFVTQQSFISPLTTSPRLERGVRAAGAVDGFTLNIETGAYSGATTVSQNMTFDATPDGQITSTDLGMNGVGKSLLMSDPMRITSSLRLENGLIDIQASDLTLASAATVSGGSLTSHVNTSGSGYFVHEGLTNSSKRYVVGTGTRYAETEITNSGTTDNVGLKVFNDVLASGTTGSTVDTVVGITYQLRELQAGGSPLTFSPKWAASDERPFFNRNLVFVEQFNASAWQNIGSTSPLIATGTDPFAVSAAISGNWSEQPIRIIGRSPAVTAAGNLYYVDDNIGQDTRTNAEAQNPNTPWQTIAKALASVSNQDSIQVFDGTYSEANLAITKSVKLFGNVVGVGKGIGAGTGTKPVVNGTSGIPSGSIFILQADSILIQNFDIRVNQTDVVRGIFSNGGGFNKLRVLDNHIFSTSTLAPSIFNSYGIQLGTTSIAAGLDSFIIARNVISPLTSGSSRFGRGIRLVGGYGLIGGALVTDSNMIMGDYGVQAGDIKRRFQLSNNHIYGQSAGLELNIPAANQTHDISSNKFNPVPGFDALSMIEIKNNTRANSIIQIGSNQFVGHQVFGVFSTRSRNVVVDGNTFIPSDTGKIYSHIVVNNKQQTTANDASTASGITITGNNFQGNSLLQGTAIAFQNHNSGAVPAFSGVVIGGPDPLSNSFDKQIGIVLKLDTASGPSTQNPLWNQPGYKVTLMRPVNDDFDIKQNNFDVGLVQIPPASMTEQNLIDLENRIVHGVDYDSLGFVTVKDQSVFVTQTSFIQPFHSTPSLQRAINQADANDGWTLLAESGTYPGKARVTTDLTVDVLNDLSTGCNTLEMSGIGKTFTINNDFNVIDSLKLVNGKVAIGSSNLILQSSALLSSASSTSYVQTNGTGQFRYINQGASAKLYPVGTGVSYFPLVVSNSGAIDQLGIRVQDDVLSSGLSGTPVDSVVNATWVATEGTSGGSNLTITPTWVETSEKLFFNRAETFAQGFTGSWTNISGGPVAATGLNPYSGVYTNITSDLNSLPIRISSSKPQVAGNLYYVDIATGQDIRTNAEAQDPNTPWKTIAKALASTVDGDSIQVFQGTYPEANLRITKSLKMFGNVVGIGVGVGAGTGGRPIVNGVALGSDSSVFTVDAPDVLLKNFQMEVDQTNIIYGVLAKTTNYDRVEIAGNRILSAGLNPLPPIVPCLRFNTIGIKLAGFSTDSILIQGNEIEPSAVDGTRCVFGRGIKLFGGHGLIGGPNDLDSNRILAYYDIQAGDIDGGRLIIENNFTVGIGVQIVAPAANSGIHIVRNNNFFLAFPQVFPNTMELKDIQNPGTGLLVTGNVFAGHSNAAIFSQRCQNVSVVGNVFLPVDTAKNYRDIVVNTKQETNATTQNPVPSSIQIKSNQFRGNNSNGAGTAIEFGNHNDDPNSAAAFINVAIGGPALEANTFNSRIGKFLVLDPLTGLSSTVPFWSSYPPTVMHPVADTFDISNNQFGVAGGLKLPADMTDDELFEVEDKVSHRIDYDSLGFVKWKPTFAYVTDSSFLKPYTTSPSIQRAVDAASSDGWQVNIEPKLMNETTNISKSIIFNTHPLDSMRLGGINMNGLDKTLTLSDKFILLNALTLNNPNGGKVRIGDNDLSTLPATVVTAGSINSYVITNGIGSLVRRGVDDQATIFPVGTVGSYAPVLFDDANNTADNFKVKVKPAATNADFTPPLPATTTTFVTFQWDICEAVTGGSSASLTFDWIDPSNVTGSGILNGISRHDGTNWNSVLATIGPGLTARAGGFANFCSGFAVVADPNLTSITTGTVVKVHPAIAGRFCVGDSVRIPFTVEGTGIIAGNSFNAFLSDADGTFPVTGGVLIGSLLGNTSDIVLGQIPIATPPGLNYRIRVVSTNIAITGSANPDSIKVFGLPARPTVATLDSVLCSGESTTLTSSLATSYKWNPNNELTQSITVATAGAYRVTISDDNGCQNTSAVRNITVNTNPVADTISYVQPLARCVGDSLLLTANPSGLSYSWLNTTPIVTTQTLLVKTTGTYQFVVTNAASCSDTSTALTVTFSPLPVKPIISLLADSVCQPDSLQFATTSTGLSYDWTISGITPNPTVQNPVIGEVGTHIATLTVTDNIGCKNTSDPITGKVKQAPSRPTIVSGNGDFSICEGDTIRLTANPASALNTYTWQPNGFVGSVYKLFLPGTATVSLSVDSLGCSSTNLLNVLTNINSRPGTPTSSITTGQNSFCQGGSAVLTSSSAANYLWTPGSDNTQAITVTTSGSYSVVTLSDSGCPSVASTPILIDVRKNPGKPTISASKLTFCFGDSATLSVVNPINANTYHWTSSDSGTTFRVKDSGSYTVRVDSTNECFAISDPLDIVRNPLPNPIITAKDGKTEVCKGDSVVLFSDSATGNVWSTGAITNSIVVKTTLGVTLTITDQNSCKATAGPVQVIVNKLPTVGLLKDTTLVFPEDVDLVAVDSTKSAKEFSWSTGSVVLGTTPIPTFNIAPGQTGRYLVTLVDTNGCKAVDSVLVRVGRELYVPNVFSPNNDGKNDVFKVYGFGIATIEVKVWDRLGNLVFETSDPDEIVETSLTNDSVKGWDGKYKDKELGQESYVWSVKGTLTTGEDVKVRGGKNSGSVIIMN